jgi:hypothetical protein
MQQLPQTSPPKAQPLFSEHSLHGSLWYVAWAAMMKD